MSQEEKQTEAKGTAWLEDPWLEALRSLIRCANDAGVLFTLPDGNGEREPFDIEDLKAHVLWPS